MGTGAALVLGSSLIVGQVRSVGAADAKAGAGGAPNAKPAAADAAESVKLTKPWSEIKSLTADQKAKINGIHTKANAQVNAIHKQEQADILALLSDAQKAEYNQVLAQDRKEANERRAARTAAAKEEKADPSNKAGDAAKDAAKKDTGKDTGGAAKTGQKGP